MTNRVTEVLNIEKPIIQGPLFWLTNAKLVAAVSNAGGLGVLGINAGQYKKPAGAGHEVTFANMRKEVRKTKELTDKPFGLNLIVKENLNDDDPYTQAMIDIAIDEQVPVVVIYAPHGTDKAVLEKWFTLLKEHQVKIVYRPATPTAEAVNDGVDCGADIIVATGFDEGGTIPDQVVGTFSAVPYVVDVVAGRVPVMAAGGIVDARTAKAAFALGAEGLFAGTIFLASEESPMADNIKQLVTETNAYDMVMFKALPRFYRSLPGKLAHQLVEDGQSETKETVWNAAGKYVGMRRGMIDGDLDHGYASFGLGISFIKDIKPVQAVVDNMYQGIPDEAK